MNNISDKEKQKIIETLQKKGANLPCPRCNNNNFTLLDGYFNQIIQQGAKEFKLGGQALPSIVTVCNKCGYMSQHVLGVLGLMSDEEDKNA